MILALDVGNSQIFGGLFDNDKMVISFRKLKGQFFLDEIGIFLLTAIRENGDYLKPFSRAT